MRSQLNNLILTRSYVQVMMIISTNDEMMKRWVYRVCTVNIFPIRDSISHEIGTWFSIVWVLFDYRCPVEAWGNHTLKRKFDFDIFANGWQTKVVILTILVQPVTEISTIWQYLRFRVRLSQCQSSGVRRICVKRGDRWPPISWHFQMHFLEWKYMNFD